jgi:hypothetical protein
MRVAQCKGCTGASALAAVWLGTRKCGFHDKIIRRLLHSTEMIRLWAATRKGASSDDNSC